MHTQIQTEPAFLANSQGRNVLGTFREILQLRSESKCVSVNFCHLLNVVFLYFFLEKLLEKGFSKEKDFSLFQWAETPKKGQILSYKTPPFLTSAS